MQVDQPRESKGTPICDHNSRLYIIEDSLPISHRRQTKDNIHEDT